MRKPCRFDPVICHRMHETFNGGILGHIVQDDGALGVIRNVFDRRVVFVVGVGVLIVENGVGPAEELRWRIDPRVEDHGSNVRGDSCVGIGGCVVHVCQDTRNTSAVDFVEEDAID